ncbi:MAG: TonB-dependent receptor [Rhizomicrobium sp.]
MRRILRGSMASAGLLGSLGLAAAQQAPDPAGVAVVETIVVTSEKRAENIQDTPISVTAFTADAMTRAGINNFSDIARTTPGLQYGDYGDVKLSPTSLRGIIGNAGSAGADPAVGFYVDEIYEGQGAGVNTDLYDIERVEVLRGPQGTLFGRNTIGGVISITTQKPSDDFTFSGTAGYGSYDAVRLGGTVSGPILPGFLDAKLSTVWDKRGGFDYNAVLGNHVNDHNAWSSRGQLLFKFDDATELLLTGAYQHVDQHPLVFETKAYDNTALLPNLLDGAGLPRNLDPYDRVVYSDTITQEKLNGYDLAARFTTRLGGVGITDIASYHRHGYYDRDDTDRSPLKMAYDGDPEKVWRYANELRADFSTGPVDWLAGVYYFRQYTNNQSFDEIGSDLADVLGDPTLTGLLIGSNAVMHTSSTAVFGSATWHATDALTFTAGARYTEDRKEIDYSQFDPVGLLGGSVSHLKAHDSWPSFTPNFNASYHITPDVMGYVTVSKGFKSGGYNDALGDANGISFGPESLWNYEGGLKTEWFDHRLVLDAAVYYMDWTKIQVTMDNPLTPVFDPIIFNGGSAHSTGVELEFTARPTEALLVGGNLSVQDARYDGGTLPTGQPLNHIPYAPNYTAALNAEYTLPVYGFGSLSLFGEYLFRGDSYLTADNQEDGHVHPYGLLNMRMSLTPDEGNWRLSLWGKNLTNTIYEERLFDLSGQTLVGQKFIVLGNPRTVGVELKIDN